MRRGVVGCVRRGRCRGAGCDPGERAARHRVWGGSLRGGSEVVSMFTRWGHTMNILADPATGSKQPARTDQGRSPLAELTRRAHAVPASAGPDTLPGEYARAPPFSGFRRAWGSERLAVDGGVLSP